MSVEWAIFRADTLEPLEVGDFGSLYKNTKNNILPILIANVGDRDAVNVRAKFIGYKRQDGQVEEVADDWKSLSYDSASAIFKKELQLPNVPAGKFMSGYKVYSENFDNIIVKTIEATGKWKVNGGKWEIYFLTEGGKQNFYLQHLAESIDINTARAIPTEFPKTINSDTSVELAVQKGNFGGIQLRLDDEGYGYWVIICPDPMTIRKINEYYSQYIPNYQPINPDSEGAIGIGKGHYTELDNFDNFNIYQKCYWLPKGTGALKLGRDKLRVKLDENVFNIYINDIYKGKWVDPNPIMTSGHMALLAGRQYSSVVIFDNLEHQIQTERGVLYVKSEIPQSPPDSLDGNNIYSSSLLLEYSE